MTARARALTQAARVVVGVSAVGVALRTLGVLSVPWWLVTAPLWIVPGMVLALALAAGVLGVGSGLVVVLADGWSRVRSARGSARQTSIQ